MSDGDAPHVRARALSKRFGPRAVLRQLDLEIHGGEVLALLGANGVGKSTLLRILALIARPDGGELELFGRPARRRDASMRCRIGLVSHALALYEELTVAENLDLFGKLQGLGADAVESAIERFALGRRAEDRIVELSRGWQQRAALARSIQHRPDLWLLDEPFVGLDRSASRSLEAALEAHAAAGGSALVVTHDVGRALALASRWALLAGGRIEQDGATAGADAAAIEDALAGAAV